MEGAGPVGRRVTALGRNAATVEGAQREVPHQRGSVRPGVREEEMGLAALAPSPHLRKEDEVHCLGCPQGDGQFKGRNSRSTSRLHRPLPCLDSLLLPLRYQVPVYAGGRPKHWNPLSGGERLDFGGEGMMLSPA